MKLGNIFNDLLVPIYIAYFEEAALLLLPIPLRAPRIYFIVRLMDWEPKISVAKLHCSAIIMNPRSPTILMIHMN